jgi:hypothetical protein
MTYNINNWYWVGKPIGQPSQVIYSSLAGALVPDTNAAYISWLNSGDHDNIPTPWPKDSTGTVTTSVLDKVLTDASLPPTGLSSVSFLQLQTSLITEANAVCSNIVAQVTPDPTHQTAYLNAAAIVNSSGGTAPTVEPLATKFAALATQNGFSSPEAFAAVVLAVQSASLDLSVALISLETSADTSTTTSALDIALTAFEGAIAAVIAEVNAVLDSPLVTPPAISIVGINA